MHGHEVERRSHKLLPWKHHVPPICSWPSAELKPHGIIPVDGDDNYCSHREVILIGILLSFLAYSDLLQK